MKTLNKICTIVAMALCITMTNGCKKEEASLPNTNPGAVSEERIPNYGSMILRMRGSEPGMYGAVNVDIASIEIQYANEKIGFHGWVSLPVRPKVYDVLQYQNGLFANLADDNNLPLGTIVKVRVTLGDRNTLTWGDSQGRHFAAMQVVQRSTTVNASAVIKQGVQSFISLNFHASPSVNPEGHNIYLLDPVITAQHIFSISDANTQ